MKPFKSYYRAGLDPVRTPSVLMSFPSPASGYPLLLAVAMMHAEIYSLTSELLILLSSSLTIVCQFEGTP